MATPGGRRGKERGRSAYEVETDDEGRSTRRRLEAEAETGLDRMEEDDRPEQQTLPDPPAAAAAAASTVPVSADARTLALPRHDEVSRRGRVFISYATADSDNVFKLVFSVLQTKGLDVFDPMKLDNPGIPEMEYRVSESDLLIAVLSPKYFDSKYCCAEAAAAMREGVTIIPVYDGDAWHHRPTGSEVLGWRDVDTAHSTPALRKHVFSGNLVRVIDTQNQAVAVEDLFRAISRRCPALQLHEQHPEALHGAGAAPMHVEENGAVELWGNHPVATPYFSGRDTEITQLHATLAEQHAAAIAALGGCGKSQLMLRVAQEASTSGMYVGGVYWVTADTPEVFGRELTELVEELGDSSVVQFDNVEDCVRAAARLLKRRPDRWLLCVDNADNADVLELLQVLWPTASRGRGAERGHLLVTSRSQDPIVWENVGLSTVAAGDQISQLMLLQPLVSHDAESILLRRRHDLRLPDVERLAFHRETLDNEERQALSDIAGSAHDYSLGGLPLALQQAGAYIRVNDISFQEYLRRYLCLFRDGSTEAAMGGIPAGEAPTRSRRAVHTTWALNVATLSPTAKGVLEAAAFFAPDAIPQRVMLSLTDHVSTRTLAAAGSPDANVVYDAYVRNELGHRSSLLTFGEQTASMHRLLRGFMRNTHGAPERRSAALTDAQVSLMMVIDAGSPDDLNTSRIASAAELVPHIISVLENDAGSGSLTDTKAKLQSAVGEIWNYRSMNTQALPWAVASLQSRIDVYGENHVKAAQSAYLVGDICYDMGDCDTALNHFQRVITILENTGTLNAEYNLATKAYSGIGAVHEYRGDFGRALYYYQQSLEMQQRFHSADDDNVFIASCLSWIGNALDSKGDYDEALRHHRQSLEMEKRIHGVDADHASIASSLTSIGNALVSKGEYDEALRHHRQSLQMQKRIHGVDANHANIAVSLTNIGIALQSKGEYDEALRHHRQSLEMKKRIHGPDADHASFAVSLTWIGNAFQSKGEYDEALCHHRQSLEMQKRIFGDDTDHADIAISVSNVGRALQSKGEDAAAARHRRLSLEMRARLNAR